jgi:hypothetical protein
MNSGRKQRALLLQFIITYLCFRMRTVVFKLIFALAAAAAIWKFNGGNLFSVLFIAALWAVLVSPHLLDILPWLKRSAETAAMQPWQGSYYEFNGRQLRFYLDAGEVWVNAADFLPLLVPAVQERELSLLGRQYRIMDGSKDRAISEAGVTRLLATRTSHRRADRQMIRLKQWLENATYPNIKRMPGSAVKHQR